MTKIPSLASASLSRRRLLGGLALLPAAGLLLGAGAASAADAPMQLSDEDRADLKRVA